MGASPRRKAVGDVPGNSGKDGKGKAKGSSSSSSSSSGSSSGSGISKGKKRGGAWAECFGLYTSQDYAELFADGAVPGLPPQAAGGVAAAGGPLRPAEEVVAAAAVAMTGVANIASRWAVLIMLRWK